MTAAHRFELNEPTIVAETVDGEVMVMNLRDGIYYSVAGAGAALWDALAGGVALEVIAPALADAAGISDLRASQDLDAFVARLGEESILRPRTDGGAGGDGEIAVTLPDGFDYAGLVVERFDDMRAMLVLDPVHEVGEFGWPQAGGERGA